jgi:general L-amino acid transport system permease protein
VAETTLNQTGRAVEVYLILLAVYLGLDLLISVLMNGLNQLVQIRER